MTADDDAAVLYEPNDRLPVGLTLGMGLLGLLLSVTTTALTISLHLLRHFASTVRHRKYSGIDIVTVEVDRSRWRQSDPRRQDVRGR